MSSVILRGIPIPLETVKSLEDLCPHGGKVVTNDKFAAYLEEILRRKKAANPSLAIKTMSTPLMPGVYYIPAEIELDPFSLGQDFRSGFHIFIECQKGFPT